MQCKLITFVVVATRAGQRLSGGMLGFYYNIQQRPNQTAARQLGASAITENGIILCSFLFCLYLLETKIRYVCVCCLHWHVCALSAFVLIIFSVDLLTLCRVVMCLMVIKRDRH